MEYSNTCETYQLQNGILIVGDNQNGNYVSVYMDNGFSVNVCDFNDYDQKTILSKLFPRYFISEEIKQ